MQSRRLFPRCHGANKCVDVTDRRLPGHDSCRQSGHMPLVGNHPLARRIICDDALLSCWMSSANHSEAFPLRTNKSLCGPVSLRPLPADYQPTEATLPGVAAEESEQEVKPEEVDDAYQSAEQLGVELVTLSLLPESRWKSLLHLDVIKVSPSDIMQVSRKPLPHRCNQRMADGHEPSSRLRW